MPEHCSLSVVMSVYNNADQLKKTIDSILNQSFADFELIVINDGSTDNSQQILDAFALSDDRIKLFQQSNKGLTNALILGCSHARAQYIARHDAGDYSSVNRFARQLSYLRSNPDCAAVFSHYQSIDELGNVIYKFCPDADAVQYSLDIDKGDISTPSHHGSVMFSKSAYLKAGEYRPSFYFTQDLDLWIRMSEHGKLHLIEDILYDTLIATDTISGKYHSLQKKYHQLIIESAKLRRRGKSDAGVLSKVQQIKPTQSAMQLNNNAAGTLYFMASCLINENPSLARDYLRRALKKNPVHLKAWYKLLFKT